MMNSLVSGALAALAVALPFTCDDDPVQPATWLPAETRACLERSGAQEALAAADLGFYRQDREADDVGASGVFFTRDFIAGVHTPFTMPERGQAYVVYVLEAAASAAELDPLDAVQDSGRASVWFVPEGSDVPHRDVEACFDRA